MKATHIAALRLVTQRLAGTRLNTAKDLVHWMGAVQAQDYPMAKWALGVRLPDLADPTVETALNDGEIIRTHVLRPTWHLVVAEDIRWMLSLTAPHIRSALASRHRELGLSEATIAKSQRIIESALAGGRHLTRQELVSELVKANMATDEGRATHLMLRAELDGLVCSGRAKGNKQTYALLAQRVPQTEALCREEALSRLARRYFASHGPATAQDFAWWSGLPAAEVRKGVAGLGPEFVSRTVDGQTYWLPESALDPDAGGEGVFLLPAYDEFLISYQDRSPSLPSQSPARVISSNGVFRPVVLVNGQVAGTWKRTMKRGTIQVETELFRPPGPPLQELIEKAAGGLGQFLNENTEVFQKVK